MEHYLAITKLNDFVFCPYSIYLHEIYNQSKEETYHSKYQSRGRRLHDFIESNTDEHDWKHAFVFSEKLRIYGKIDEYNIQEKELIEYKSTVAIAFRGYYYQIWSQYLCLKEMGVEVSKLAFYDFRQELKIPISLPTKAQIEELKNHIKKVQRFNFDAEIHINPNKCMKCIYRNLCDKTTI